MLEHMSCVSFPRKWFHAFPFSSVCQTCCVFRWMQVLLQNICYVCISHHLLAQLWLLCVTSSSFLKANTWMVLLYLLRRTILLLFLSPRCSSCFCSAGRESCVCRNGMCLCRTRRERKSPETWSRLFLPASPRCAASWSGGISKLYTKGRRCEY